MNSIEEEIRTLYQVEEPATATEYAALEHDVRTNPNEARKFITALFSLTSTDSSIATLAAAFISSVLMQDIQARAVLSDDEALRFGAMIFELMKQNAPPQKTSRGKPKGRKPINSA